jgi:hypothetical protein
MKHSIILILFLLTSTLSAQSIRTITVKLSDKICDCIKDNIAYSELFAEMDRCYIKKKNHIFNIVDSVEQKILLRPDAFKQINNNIVSVLKSRCKKVKKIIRSEMATNIASAKEKGIKLFPVNFNGTENFEKLDGEIIAFEGTIIKVKTINELPYYQMQLSEGHSVWVVSLVPSGYEKKNRNLRIMGYLSKVNNINSIGEINKLGYHVLALAIIDIKTEGLFFVPGSEYQIIQWINGKIPKAIN